MHPSLQFTKLGVNPCHISDRLVWAVRSNDLTHWATRTLGIDMHSVYSGYEQIFLTLIKTNPEHNRITNKKYTYFKWSLVYNTNNVQLSGSLDNRDRMVVGFTTTCAISGYHNLSSEFESCSWLGVIYTTLCDKVCQWLAPGRWFSPATSVSSITKTDGQD